MRQLQRDSFKISVEPRNQHPSDAPCRAADANRPVGSCPGICPLISYSWKIAAVSAWVFRREAESQAVMPL